MISQTRHVEGTPFGTRGGVAVVHDFPADGKYSFRLTFYYHQMGTTLFGQTPGKGQIEVSVDGERIALFDINPLMKQTEDLRTPFIPIHAGPRRVAAAFIQKFEGAVEDEVSPPEQSLVDVNVANIPGLTTPAASAPSFDCGAAGREGRARCARAAKELSDAGMAWLNRGGTGLTGRGLSGQSPARTSFHSLFPNANAGSRGAFDRHSHRFADARFFQDQLPGRQGFPGESAGHLLR